MKFSRQSTNEDQQATHGAHLIPTNQEYEALSPEGVPAAAPQVVELDIDMAISEAIAWYDFGLNVTPVFVGTTQAAVAVKQWVADLSYQAIDAHWAKHPGHIAGFVVGENLIVFRTKGKEADKAFARVLKAFHAKPAMVVRGSEGIEFFFWRANRTNIAPIPGSSERLHGHIEILTDDAIVLLPPNRGKTILVAASNTGDFTEVSQDFIDAVRQHNASPAEVVMHDDAESAPEAAAPDAAALIVSKTGPIEGGTGGQTGGLPIANAYVTPSATLTAYEGQPSQECSQDANLPTSVLAANDATLFTSGSLQGGEGGVRFDGAETDTAYTPLTALAGPSLKNVDPESAPSVAALAADSSLSKIAPIEGGEGGEAGVQVAAASTGDLTFSKIALIEGGEAGEGGVFEVAAVDPIALQGVVLAAATSPLAANNANGYAGDDDDVLTPKAANNPVITALEAAGLYLTPLGSGKHAIACPWAHEHGAGERTNATYFEPDEFHSTGGFRCPHEHLERHTTRDLLEFLGVPHSEAKHKPVIRVVPGELYRVVAAAEMVLEDRQSYFQAGGLIVSIVTDPTTGDPRILPTSVQALTSALSLAATFEKFDGRSGSWVPCDPPNRYVGILFKKQDYPHLSALAGLARQPYFRETDGALVTQPGYDKAVK